jgi:hypothetical protein
VVGDRRGSRRAVESRVCSSSQCLPLRDCFLSQVPIVLEEVMEEASLAGRSGVGGVCCGGKGAGGKVTRRAVGEQWQERRAILMKHDQ